MIEANEAEQALIGSLLMDVDGELLPACMDRGLRPDHFYVPDHIVIFDAILSVNKKRRPIDFVTVSEELPDDMGFMLDDLTDKCSVPHAMSYLEIVMNAHARRKLIVFGREVMEKAKALDDAEESRTFAASELQKIQDGSSSGDKSDVDICAKVLDRWDKAISGNVGGVSSRLEAVNSLIGGYSEYTVLAARPSCGKSTLMLNDVVMSSMQGKHTAVASLEMTLEQCLKRMASDLAGVNLYALNHGLAPDEHKSRAMEKMRYLADLDTLHITDRSHSPESMSSWARCAKIKHDIQILWVDYLQLLRPSQKYSNGNERVQDFSRQMLSLRKELDIPVIVLCQLNRSVESENRKPRMSDLRDSGAIEQDAHTIMFLSRKLDEEDTVLLDVQKNRDGPTGERFLRPMFNRQRFEDKVIDYGSRRGDNGE